MFKTHVYHALKLILQQHVLLRVEQQSKTYPLLTITVLQIVHSLGVPLFTEADQAIGPETILTHDHEVGEETGRRLHHANLPIRH